MGSWVDRRPGSWVGLMLEQVDPARLGDHDLVSVIAAYERQIAHLHAVQATAIAELAGRQAYARCARCPGDAVGASDGSDPAARGSEGASVHPAAAEDDGGWVHLHDPVPATAQELGPVLALSPRQAETRVAAAVDLVGALPATADALNRGRLDWRRAVLIVERTRLLSARSRGEVERDVAGRADGRTTAQLARLLDRAVMAADATATKARREAGQLARRVCPPQASSAADGIGELTLTGPIEDLAALYAAVDAAARHARSAAAQRTDARTLDQLRFDTLTGLGWTALNSGHLGCCAPSCALEGDTARTQADPADGADPADSAEVVSAERADMPGPRWLARRRRRPATVNVTLAFTTLVGLDDEPGELDGHGPIPASVARRIAGDATLRRLLTDPATGALLEYGRTAYAPPQPLVEHVIARDRTCRFPTCSTPADVCDVDHAVAWRAGGTTGRRNNHALSRGCHVGKTLHGWALRPDPDGGLVWTSPAGHTHRVPPEIVGLVRPASSLPPPPEPDPPPF